MKNNLIRCGRCGKIHNVGSKKFLRCREIVKHKLQRKVRIAIKGSGHKLEGKQW